MAIGELGEVKDTFQFDEENCLYPAIAHVFGDIYAVTYEGPTYYGKIFTVEIDSLGAITEPPEDTWTYSTSAVQRYYPDILHAAGTRYLQATRNNGASTIVSFIITDEGAITKEFSTPVEIVPGLCHHYDLIHVSGTIYALAVQHPTGFGYMDTFSCDAAGNVAMIDSGLMSYATSFAYARILEIYPNRFAICYRSGTTVRIAVASLNASWEVTRTDEQYFNSGTGTIGHTPCQNLSTGIIAVAFAGQDAHAYLQTIAINSVGVVTNLSLDSYEFYTESSSVKDLISLGSNYFALIYQDTDDHGVIETFYISDTGTITRPHLDIFVFEDVAFYNGYFAPFQYQGCLTVVYEGPDHDGFIKTISVESPRVGVPHHEMLTGVGP